MQSAGDDRRHRPRGRRVEVDRVARAAGAAGWSGRRPASGCARRSSSSATSTIAARPTCARRRRDIVGMVINDLTNPFFAELAVGIEAALAGGRHRAVPRQHRREPERQGEVMRSMREHGVAGLILCPALGTDAPLLAEIEAWRPAGGDRDAPPAGRLDTAWRRTISAAARARHRASDRARPPADRLSRRPRRHGRPGGAARRATRAALAAAGLPADPALIVEAVPNRDGGMAASAAGAGAAGPADRGLVLQRRGRLRRRSTAWPQRGLAAGRDFAVVGFDDIVEAAPMQPRADHRGGRYRSAGRARRAAFCCRSIAARDAGPQHFIGEAALVVRA